MKQKLASKMVDLALWLLHRATVIRLGASDRPAEGALPHEDDRRWMLMVHASSPFDYLYWVRPEPKSNGGIEWKATEVESGHTSRGLHMRAAVENVLGPDNAGSAQ